MSQYHDDYKKLTDYINSKQFYQDYLNGNQQAISAIESYSKRMINVLAAKYRLQIDDAEDILMNALTRMMEYFDRFKPAKGNFLSWFNQIIVNCYHDYITNRDAGHLPLDDQTVSIQHQQPEKSEVTRPQPDNPDPFAAKTENLFSDPDFIREFNRLSKKERLALKSFALGNSDILTAKYLKVSENTVRSFRSRGLRKLKTQLQNQHRYKSFLPHL